LDGLTQRGDSKNLNPAIEDADDLLETVSVGIGLHDGHDTRLAGQFFDGLEIMP